MLLPEKSTTVATINQQKILVVSKDGTNYVPIRPICDVFGVDFSAQLQRIKRDPIFSSVVVTVTTTGSDKKQYEMAALPHEFIFGWLFTIDTNLVKPEIREAVIDYKRECNHALYDHFKSYADYVEFRMKKIEEAEAVEAECRMQFNTAKDRITEAKRLKAEAYGINYAEWLAGKRQLEIAFSDAEETHKEGGAS